MRAVGITTERQRSPLREGELLVVHRFYANGDAKLVSMFHDHHEGSASHSVDGFPWMPSRGGLREGVTGCIAGANPTPCACAPRY
jgi:hypothetical protein